MKRFLVKQEEEEDETSIHTTKKAKIKRKYPSTFLAVNANGFEVNAPTGHKSITFPLNSELNNLLTYVPISA